VSRSTPFSTFPLIRTSAIEEAEVQLSRSIIDLEILSVADRRQFELVMNRVAFCRTSLVSNYFGSETQIRSKVFSDSLLFIVGNGVPATFILDGETVTVSPHKAAVHSPHHSVKVIRPGGSEIIVVKISEAVLNSYFQKITGQYHKSSLLFPHGIDLDSAPGVNFKETLKYIIDELVNNEFSSNIEKLHDVFDHMIMTKLLELPHNLRDQYYANRFSYDVPFIVKRAEEYMEAHLTDSIKIADLLSICKCSRSALFSAFQTKRGYSPMEFIIERRLQRARKMLQEGKSCESVSSIAMESGFTHLGRFSLTYKKRFGESPRETIHKSK
jgi:AraC-like DNA-binding protein